MNVFMLLGLGVAEALGSTPLAQCVAAEAQRLDFSGVVSIVQPGGTTTSAWGALDKVGGPRIGPDTRFNLGSASKMFTAVAVAQLVDAGKVHLEDPIGLQVKGLGAEAATVTVRQLLTHSAGLGNFFSPENLPALEKARSVSELLPLVASEKPSFAPGSRFQYSSSGFLLLGMLIERVSGQSYDQYLQRHLFEPARMVATGLEPGPAAIQAVGMTAMPAHPPGPAGRSAASGSPHLNPGAGAAHPKGPLRPAPEAVLRGNPAGGCYSTATDLQRFFAALLGGQLISAAMLKAFSSPQIVAAPMLGGAPQGDYGFGFGVGTVESHRWFGHNGGAPGVNTEAVTFPDDRTAVVVMSNRDPPSASALFRKVRGVLFDPAALKACAAAPDAGVP